MPYVLNGQEQQISEEPIERDGRHFVPLAQMVETLGGQVTWDNNTKTAQATIGQWTANVQEGNTNVNVSGTPVNLSAAPYVENGTMYVPWDFFRDAYGYKTNMEGDTLYVHL
jgi:hypothetical protein